MWHDAFRGAKVGLTREAEQLRAQLKAVLPHIPIVSLQQPLGWIFEPISIVTAQTITGTGLFSDVTSAFTDLFGTQSGSYNANIRDGEELCKASLRGQALETGENAIVGVDVDYAEVGGQRAMLMVCMTGTAVRVTHLEKAEAAFLETVKHGVILAKRSRAIQSALRQLN